MMDKHLLIITFCDGCLHLDGLDGPQLISAPLIQIKDVRYLTRTFILKPQAENQSHSLNYEKTL